MSVHPVTLEEAYFELVGGSLLRARFKLKNGGFQLHDPESGYRELLLLGRLIAKRTEHRFAKLEMIFTQQPVGSRLNNRLYEQHRSLQLLVL